MGLRTAHKSPDDVDACSPSPVPDSSPTVPSARIVQLEVKNLMQSLSNEIIYDDDIANEILKKMHEIQHLYQIDKEGMFC